MSSTTPEKCLTEAQRNLASDTPPPLFRFVFTGGPCGGKTTALARVFSYLRERGFEVITCPEAYTTLSSSGMSVDFFSTPGMASVIQRTVLEVQMAFEDGIHRVLKARGKPAVMLCDRGTMDGSVYLEEEEFVEVLKELNTDIVQVRDNRYDAVFHLITAADGAETFYTLENNQVRTETKEEARLVDRKTQRAWVGHPHFYFIDNSTDFEGKMNRLVDTLSKIVGLPSNLRRRSVRFLLRHPPDLSRFPPEIDFRIFEVEKIYLQQNPADAAAIATENQNTTNASNENYSFIRRRTNVNHQTGKREGSVYQITTAQWTDQGELIEQKRIISYREYMAASWTRDQSRHVVQQRRISFLYNKQSFVVHIYESPAAGLCILHAQVEGNGDPKVDLPPFLDVDRRLMDSDDNDDKDQYGAYNLSIIR